MPGPVPRVGPTWRICVLNWLISAAGQALDLAAERSVLQAVSILSGLVASGRIRLSELSPGVADLPTLLVRLGESDVPLRERLAGALREQGLSLAPEAASDAEVLGDLGRLAADLRGRLPELQLVACPWARLAAGGCGPGAAALHWRGLDRTAAARMPPGDGLRLDLTGEIDRALTFEPLTASGPDQPVELPSGVRLRLTGEIDSAGALSVPLRWGRVDAGSGARSEIRVDWLVDRCDDSWVAQSFGAALAEATTSPLDLSGLHAAFEKGRLRALSLEAAGALGLSGSLSVGVTGTLFGVAAAAGIDAGLGVELGFHASRRGTYRIAVYPDQSPSAGRLGVRVDVHRIAGRQERALFAAGLSLDLSRTLEGLRGDLIRRTGDASALLEDLRGLFPPSATLRADLERRLAAKLRSPELREALEDVLGASVEAPVTARLRHRLETALDARSDLWSARIIDVAGRVATDALASLPLDAATSGTLQRILDGVAQDAVAGLRDRLEAEVRERLAHPGAARRLEQALAAAEAGGRSGLRRLDSAADRVRAQLDRFQQALSELAGALARSAAVRIDARWRSEEQRARGRSVDQSLLFAPGHPDAAELFRRTLTGSLDDVFARLAGRAPDPAGPVELISGSLQEVASLQRESGLELALIDFQLGSGSLLDADVVVETDASGNVRVCARALSRWRRWRPAESTAFEAVNVFELATASHTRHMSLSLSLSQLDESLKRREVEAFFGSLASPHVGLLRERQLDVLRRALPEERDLGSGELRAWLELGEPQLLRLLRIRDPRLGPSGSPVFSATEREIFDIAVDAMVGGMRATGSRADLNNLARFLGVPPDGDALARELKSLRGTSLRARYGPDPTAEGVEVTDQPLFDRLERIVRRAEGMVELIEAMRRLYFSSPGPGWSLADYQRLQARIDRIVRLWVKGEPADRGLLPLLLGHNDVDPYVLAYLKAIVDLCRDPGRGDGTSTLMASLLLPGPGGGNEIRLTAEPAAEPLPPLPPRPLAGRSRPPVQGAAPVPPSPTVARPATGTVFGVAGTAVSPSADHGVEPSNRSPVMSELIFPLEKRIRSYHVGGARFGAGRPGGRLHAACDLKVPAGTRVLAMGPGEVVRGPYYFYSNTYALEVAHSRGDGSRILVRYGEINQRVPTGIRPGGLVRRGELIATVGQLKSGSSMLHLEMYRDGDSRAKLTVSGISRYKRRGDLMDPTPILDGAPTLEELEQVSGAGPVSAGGIRYSGTVSRRVPSLLNVRRSALIKRGEKPVARLEPGAPLQVLGAVNGGSYPYGLGNLWLRVNHRRDPAGEGFIDDPGFVVGYFIDTDYPIAGDRGLGEDAETGYVSRLDTGLNIRSAPSTDSRVLYVLPKGSAVKVLSQVTGGGYGSNRNDWLEVLPAEPANDAERQKGFAAAFYIDIGERRREHGALAGDPQDQNRWERVLVRTEWAGCSTATASAQLGGLVAGGAEASQRIAANDVDAVKELAGVFHDVAAKFGVPAALLAGIASRESHVGKALVGGWGDRGNGFGIMQVDRNAHRVVGGDPRGMPHIEQAAGIFARNLELMMESDRYAGWEDKYLLLGATAAYNFGIRNVRTRERIDAGTTGDDYGSDTLARAKYFYLHEALHELRD